MNPAVNNILTKFIDTNSFDHRKNHQEYLQNRHQFRRWVENEKPLNDLPQKKKTDISDVRHINVQNKYINVDSSNRDEALFPFANSYEMNLQGDNLINVYKVNLVSTMFRNPISQIKNTTVSETNNQIRWSLETDDPTQYMASVPPGNYTASTLQRALQTTLNSVPRKDGSPQMFYVDINTDTTEICIGTGFPRIVPDCFSRTFPQKYVTITYPNHSVTYSSKIYIQNADEPIFLIIYPNGIHNVINILSPDEFMIDLEIPGPTSITGTGGANVTITIIEPFTLYFEDPQSIGPVLGYDPIRYESKCQACNIQRIRADEFIEIISVLPVDGNPNESQITTLDPHNITTGTRIFIYPTTAGPELEYVEPYTHAYDVNPLNDEEKDKREAYRELITDSAGYIATAVGPNDLVISIPYGDYITDEPGNPTLSEYLSVTFVGRSGDIILKEELNLDFESFPYFFITSKILGDELRFVQIQNDSVQTIFAKIQLPGTQGDLVINSFVGGEKYFFDAARDELRKIDLQFYWPDGTLVDFGSSEHSMVFQVTQLQHKMNNTDLNTRVGVN